MGQFADCGLVHKSGYMGNVAGQRPAQSGSLHYQLKLRWNAVKYIRGAPTLRGNTVSVRRQCHNNFSCIAFAISSVAPGVSLPQLQIRFTLLALRDIVVNAWIVVAEPNSQTTFVAGRQDGTIMVPASEPSVLSVAGLRSTGQMWEGSSRGPAAQYDPAAVVRANPLMAHLANLGSDFGTSYASPRACADAAATLADPIKRPKCIDAESLLSQMYGLTTLSQ